MHRKLIFFYSTWFLFLGDRLLNSALNKYFHSPVFKMSEENSVKMRKDFFSLVDQLIKSAGGEIQQNLQLEIFSVKITSN